MQLITPFRTLDEACAALDNGGRIYNLFTHAGDDLIEAAELGKASGVGGWSQEAYIYLQLALADLSTIHREALLDRLTPKLQMGIAKNTVHAVDAGSFAATAKNKSSYVVEGVARASRDEVVSNGIMVVPMMMGTVMTVMAVPVAEHYQILDVGDGGDATDVCQVAIGRKDAIPTGRIRWGGIAKSIDAKGGAAPRMILVAAFATSLA